MRTFRIPLSGSGTAADPYRPDLPAGASYTVVEQHEDGTVTVEVDPATFIGLAGLDRPEHVLEWQPPTGAHDAPNIGDHRWYDSQVWRSLINGNTTVPGSDPRWWEPSDPPAIPDKLRNPLRALRPQVAAANNVAQLRDALLAVLDTLTGDV
jgi:hypothetical protein